VALSASTDRRELRRAETARRIHVCAQELALAHGLDGFSMDDLAAAADVSRRTLFNYFHGKDAAVLGETPEFDPELVETFVAGGPHGNLTEDVVVLVGSFLGGDGLQREDVARLKSLMAREPRLISLVQERFEERAGQLARYIEAREQGTYDAARTRVFVHVMAALFDHAMTIYLEQPDRELGDLYAEAVALARSALS
jgi:AcrR family transcriptional regulator